MSQRLRFLARLACACLRAGRASGRPAVRVRQGLLALCLGLLLPALAQAAVTITRTSSPLFYMDAGDGLLGTYVSYQVTSTTAQNDVWVGIGSFTGGVVARADFEDGVQQLGPFTAGQTKTAFFYLKASGTTASAQGHTLSVYNFKPPAAPAIATQVFTLSSVDSTIAAAANKVTTTVTGPNPAGLGGTITMTVTGNTGTLGAAGILSFTPASYTGWRADAYELYDSAITLPSGTVLNNQLYTSGQSTGGAYTLVYRFRAVGITSAPTTVSPIGYISSGTQIKHTSVDTAYAALPPVQSASNTLTLAKSFTPAAPNAGDTLTYRLRVSNSGSAAASLEQLLDTLPASPATPAYVNGSSTWGGAPFADPLRSGNLLTWSGTLTVPANSTRDLEFQVIVPAASGSYVNTAIGTIGSVQIDATLDTTQSSPAGATFTLGPDLTIDLAHSGNFTQGQSGATYTATVSNSGNANSSGTVTVISTLPAGLTPTAASGTGWGCGVAGQTVTCTRSDALAPAGSYPALTLTVNVGANAGSPLNSSASVSGGTDVNPGNNSDTDATTVTLAAADLSSTFSTLPAHAAPGAVLNGNVTCTNQGPGTAVNATCTANASGGATLALSSCTASSGSAAALPSGATLTCPFTFTLPGTPGGSDTAATSAGLSSGSGASNSDPNAGNNSASASVNLVDALNDSASLPHTGGIASLRGNDTVGGSAASAGNSAITFGSALPPGFTFDAASGSLVIAPGTAAGSYPVPYTLCTSPADTPAACDTATASVTVAAAPAPADMGAALTGLPVYAAPGTSISLSLTCTNSGTLAASNAACSASGLPGGAVLSCTPAVPVASLAGGASISCTATFAAPASGSLSISASTGADSDANAGNNSAAGSTAIVDAVADSGSLLTSGGTVALLGNDSLGGNAATAANTSVSLTTHGGISGATVNASGQLVVPPGTPAGSYTLTYRLCAIAAPAVCDSASISLTVNAPADMAVALSGVPAHAAPGSTVNLTVTCTNSGTLAASNAACSASGLPGGASLSCTPAVPAASLAGGASISCTSTFAAPASATLSISASTTADSDANAGNNSAAADASIVDAVADSGSALTTGGTVPLLGNDTLGGSAATPGSTLLTLTSLGGMTGASVDASGQLVVPAGTPAGSYTLSYQLCALAAPTVCDSASVTVGVSPPSVPADMAVALTGLPAWAAPGSTVNLSVTCSNSGSLAASNVACAASGLPGGAVLSCTPAVPVASLAGGASISCTATFAAPASGTLAISASTSASSDANAGNNSASASSSVVDAVADSGTVSTSGGTVTLLANDTLGGSAASASNTQFSLTSSGGLVGASLNGSGQLVVPPGTPAGSYTLGYRLCALGAPSVCDNASITLTVNTPADMTVTLAGLPAYVAPGSLITVTLSCSNLGTVAASNASCSASGLPPGTVLSCTPTVPVASLAGGGSIRCSATFTPPTTGTLNLVATAAADNDATPANNSASVSTALVDAAADSASLPATGGSVPLLGNDRLGASLATPANSAVTLTAHGGLAGASLDVNGQLVVPPGTPVGSYTLSYQLCALAAPSVCDSASISVTVASPADLRAAVTGLPATAAPGSTVIATLTCTNDGGSAATNASCGLTGLPPGASLSCTPASPVALLAPGQSIQCAFSYTVPASGSVTLVATAAASEDSDNSNNIALSTTAVAVNHVLDVVKASASPAATQVGTSAFDVGYVLTLKNQGNAALPNVQVADSLATSFASGSPVISQSRVSVTAGTCIANASYDGVASTGLLSGSDTLAAGASCTLSLRARITYADAGAVSQVDNGNLAYASAVDGAGPNPGHRFTPGQAPTPPAGAVATDISTAGSTPPATPNGDAPGGSAVGLRLPRLASVSGSIFVDVNGNGLQDANELPRARYLVQVVQPTDPARPEVASTLLPYLQVVTNADGSYTLPGVPTGIALALRYVPLAEGSGTTPATAVPAVPPGTLGVPLASGTPTNGAPGVNTSSSGAVRGFLPLNISAATLPASGVVPQQNLPIDPSGVVYDSATREPLAGATVRLLSASGQPVPEGTVYGGAPSVIVTNADGAYAFWLNASAVPGRYRLAVTPPATHTAAATLVSSGLLNVPAGSGAFKVQPQSTAPAWGQDTPWYDLIDYTLARDVIHNHIPLDRVGAAALFIDKQADRRSAQVGDAVLYRIRVRNPNPFAVADVRVADQLPLGFKLIAGTSQWRIGSAAAIAGEPAGAPGPALRYSVGTLPANTEVVLSYRVRIGLGAEGGTGSNSAQAAAAGLNVGSRVARATVRVSGGVFGREACVIGKVYADCNDNGVQDAGEPGLASARLLLPDGTALITDDNGQYSHCGLRALTNVIKLDRHSLPPGAELGLTSNRNAGDAGSLFIDPKAGELHRADFRLQFRMDSPAGQCGPAVLREVEQRRRAMVPAPSSGTAPASPAAPAPPTKSVRFSSSVKGAAQ